MTYCRIGYGEIQRKIRLRFGIELWGPGNGLLQWGKVALYYYGLALPLHASRGNGTFAVYSTYIGIDHLCFGGKIRKRIRSHPEPRIFYRLSAMGWHRVRF